MNNPSSTKPYPITITIYSSTSSSASYSGSLSVTVIANSTFPLIGYSTDIGVTSNVEFYLTPNYALKLDGAYLETTFDSALIGISFGNSSIYTVSSSGVGSAVFGGFLSASINSLRITNVTMINPEAALSFTINCRFYLLEAGVQYDVEAFYAENTLLPIGFTTLTSASVLQYGVASPASVVSICTSTQVSISAADPAYSIITFNSSQLTPQASSNCLPISSNTCKHTLTDSYTLSQLLTQIDNFNSASITVTSYTSHQGSYFPLCTGRLTLDVVQQSVSPAVNVAGCQLGVAEVNGVNLTVDVSSGRGGDVVYVTGLLGAVTDAAWTATTISSVIWYSYSLTASDLTPTTPTTTTSVISSINIPLTYSNPSYTTLNSLTQVTIHRSSLIYAASSVSASLCSVSTPLAINAYSLASSSLLSYSLTTLQLDVTMGLFDYVSGDYLLVRFNSGNAGEQYVLDGSWTGTGAGYGVSVNGVAVGTVQVNSSTLRLTMESGTLPSVGRDVLSIVLTNLANPPFAS